MKEVFRFVTILFAVLTLSALVAHLLELPGKINLSKEDYRIVQGIYRGWSWLGIFEIGALLCTLLWTIIDRSKKSIFPFLSIACIVFMISMIIFFTYTFPANSATLNWTELPENWEALRKQ